MVGELPNIKITSTADITDETIHSEATINPLGVESSPNISKGIHPNTGEATDHAKLEHLDYASSGHTGFASSEDLVVVAQATAPLGAFTQETVNKLKSNFSANIELNNRFLTLSSRAGNLWTYTSSPDQSGTMYIMTVNMLNGSYQSSAINPAKSDLNAHIQNTEVHIQAGERKSWNEKVSAEVIVEEEKLKFF